ncbi:MAG: D-hydantoinase [Chloroflexi bacterium]|nr:D-hydantoinase [Chloroflexota bacterium]
MTSKTIIKNGTLITASDTFQADILIKGEKISAIGNNFRIGNAEVIDATGKLIMPGGIDPHTHFDLPMFGTVSSDDHYTGHKAAAFGGTTTVMDFVPLLPPLPPLPLGCPKGTQSEGPGVRAEGVRASRLRASVETWRAKADPKAAIDFGFHMNITEFTPQIAAEIPSLVEMGITTLKVFTAYNGRLRLHDGEIFEVLRIAKEHGLLTMLHAENGDVIETLVAEALATGHTSPEWHAHTRPGWGAVEAVLRGISLAAQADAPLYLVHMNTAGGADMLQYARERGLPVMGETTPPYLFFTVDHLRPPDGAKWICSPPMRSQADNARLWEALETGLMQTMGTDHCPFFYDGTTPIRYEGEEVAIPGKELGADDFTKIPNGLPCVGDRLPILWTEGVGTGRLTPNQYVALTSTNPAKIFGLYPRKGTLIPGADADILIWDQERELTYGVQHAHHRTDYNLFEGWKLKGYPEKVFLRGHLIIDGQEWRGKAGMGQFLKREPGAEVL